jgi:hypothetical protein
MENAWALKIPQVRKKYPKIKMLNQKRKTVPQSFRVLKPIIPTSCPLNRHMNKMFLSCLATISSKVHISQNSTFYINGTLSRKKCIRKAYYRMPSALNMSCYPVFKIFLINRFKATGTILKINHSK